MVPTHPHDIHFTNEPDDIIHSSGDEYHDGIQFSDSQAILGL